MTIACLTVSDVQKAKWLFVEVLGMTLKHDVPDYNWMEFQGKEGGRIGVGQSSEDQKSGKNAILSIAVDNIEEMRNHLISQEIEVGEITEVPGHVKLAPFKDQDGNNFFLAQNL